jgi:hypothetical protein
MLAARLSHFDPQETLGDETEGITRRLRTVTHLDISLWSKRRRDRPGVPAAPFFGMSRNWILA